MNENYVIYHLHSSISNLTAGTGADSVTNPELYIKRAKELGMKAIAFSEHGSVINWIKKKKMIEENDEKNGLQGMKYIHANEVYLTKHLDKEKGLIRDNYHYMLIAKNYEGVLELNKLTSKSFNREDGHFYYNPRIPFDELKNTSDNIIMASACLASPLWRMYKESRDNFGNVINKGINQEWEELLHWMYKNKHRMFLKFNTMTIQSKLNTIKCYGDYQEI